MPELRSASTPVAPPRSTPRMRPLTIEDAPGVAAIAAQLGQPTPVEYWRRKLDQFAGEAACGLGAEVDSRLVAYMLGQIHGGEFGLPEETAFLELIGVDPAWQGRGLARALAEALFEHLAQRGVRRVLTLVNGRDETVRPFFRALGLRQSQLVCLERRL